MHGRSGKNKVLVHDWEVTVSEFCPRELVGINRRGALPNLDGGSYPDVVIDWTSVGPTLVLCRRHLD